MNIDVKPGSKLSFEELQIENEDVSQAKRGTDADIRDMTRMGKKQVLRVRHNSLNLTCPIR